MYRKYALVSGLIGLGFLAIAILNFLDGGSGAMAGGALLRSVAQGAGLFWLQILTFLFALALIYAAVGWLLAWLGQPVAEWLIRSDDEQKKAVLLLFLAAHIWIILENAAQFPASTVGARLHDIATFTAVQWFNVALGTLILLTLATGAALRLRHWLAGRRIKTAAWITGLLGSGLILAGMHWATQPTDEPFPTDPKRPHVLMIGIDGWRPDVMTQWGAELSHMPFLESMLDETAYFEEAITPLARSFPGWWTILTGQNPITHGARFNLIDQSRITSQADLLTQLGDEGYHRIFAMDERRFAAIRDEHGLDRFVGPGLGASDFLVGGLNDTPLGNLIVNSQAGHWIFPYSHGNRAVAKLYRPGTFDRMLRRALETSPRQPLFLAVHYEMPHWPYTWADGPEHKHLPHPLGIEFASYLETLEQTDQQIEYLFSSLERLELLNNALVVILSDHGHSFSTEDLSWQHESRDISFSPPSGHGTSILDPLQHLVPVAFQWFGRDPFPSGMRRGRISLADIYPTLSELLDLRPGHPLDGISLVDVLNDENLGVTPRILPIETGLDLGAATPELVSPQRLLSQAAGYYYIDRRGLVQFRPDYTDMILSTKQRGVIKDNLMMVPFEVDAAEPFIAWRIADMETRTYWDEVDPIDPESRGYEMSIEFCSLFAKDRKHLPSALCSEDLER